MVLPIIDSAGQIGDSALHRTNFTGPPTTWRAADWTFGPSSRD